MGDTSEITVVLGGTEADLIPLQFSEFLVLFDKYYAVALRSHQRRGILFLGFDITTRDKGIIPPTESELLLSQANPQDTSSGLTISRMLKASRAQVTFRGMATALVAAVIISGGDIKMPVAEVHLPPLAQTIKGLRDALGISSETVIPNLEAPGTPDSSQSRSEQSGQRTHGSSK